MLVRNTNGIPFSLRKDMNSFAPGIGIPPL